MLSKRRSLLAVEQLESRDVPRATPTLGTFQITDTTVNPDRTWESESRSDLNTVPKDDTLIATLEVTVTFTGPEQAMARHAEVGVNWTEEIRWREDDAGPDSEVAKSYFTHKFKNIGATATTSTIVLAPPNFTTTNNAHTDGGTEGPTAEYYGWLNDPSSPFNFSSKQVWLQNWTAIGQGANQNARAGTAGITYGDGSAFANPALPDLANGVASYRILAFDSTDGANFTVSSLNASGYNLLSASSAALAWDATNEDLVIDPSTTFATAYSTGATTSGSWSGGETAWAIRNSAGDKTFYLSGYSYSKMPTSLFGLPDNQSTSVSGSSLQVGNDVLWLFFETDGETVCFLLTGRPTPTVWVTPADLHLTEGVSGTFSVKRDGDLSSTMTVYLSLGTVPSYGPPLPGIDFSGGAVSGGSAGVTGSFPSYSLAVTFNANSDEVVISFAPFADGLAEGTEAGSATLTSVPSGYTIDPMADEIDFYFHDA